MLSLVGVFIVLAVYSGRWSISEAFDTRLIILISSVLLFGIHFSSLKSKVYAPSAIYCVLFSVYSLYSIAQLGFSPDVWLSLDKILSVMTINTLLVLISLYFSDLNKIKAFYFVSLIVLSILAVSGVIGIVIFGGRSSSIGGGPNVFGRLMLLLFILTFIGSMGKTYFRYIVTFISMTLVLLTGSRGSYIGLGIAIVGVLTYRIKYHFRTALIPVALIGFLMWISYSKIEVITRAVDFFNLRFIDLTITQGYTSGRDWIFEQAFQGWKSSPWFGQGLNYMQSIEGLGYYAHNFELEGLSDHGLVGFIIMVIPFIYSGYILFKNRPYWNYFTYISLMSLISIAATVQFSGDVYDSRYLYIYSLLCILSLRSERSKLSR